MPQGVCIDRVVPGGKVEHFQGSRKQHQDGKGEGQFGLRTTEMDHRPEEPDPEECQRQTYGHLHIPTIIESRSRMQVSRYGEGV